MLVITPQVRIFVCLAPTDMRRSLDGLAALARGTLNEEPLHGHLFVFHNKRGDRLKVLFWDRNGFCLLYKRLERGRFSLPKGRSGKVVLSDSAFQLLLGGLSLEKVWNHQ